MTANDTEQHRQTVSKSNPRKIKLHGLERKETFAFKSAHSAGLPAAREFWGKRSAEKKGRTFTKTRKVRKTICKISENSRPNITVHDISEPAYFNRQAFLSPKGPRRPRHRPFGDSLHDAQKKMKQQPCSKNIASQPPGFLFPGRRAAANVRATTRRDENRPKPYFILGRRRKKPPNSNTKSKSAKCI